MIVDWAMMLMLHLHAGLLEGLLEELGRRQRLPGRSSS